MFLTVFTATYNRAHTLPKLFQSLQQQGRTDFEWLLIDDGSSDDTHALVTSFKSSSPFPISFYRQVNSGKYIALNRGLDLARGTFFFIVDSDDHLLPDTLNRIESLFESVSDDRSFCGVAGRKLFPDHSLIGSPLPADTLDTSTLELRLKHRVSGDLAEVFLTSIISKYRFPEFHGEKYFAPSYLYNLVSQNYRIRYTSIPFTVCEYLPDGLTAQNVNLRYSSPTCASTFYSQYARYDLGTLEKLKTYTNYWRFSLSRGVSFKTLLHEVPLFSTTLIPFALMIRIIDRNRNTSAKKGIFS
jgi:glycosyltransferase involved in cell wall biosynthesis